jgi:2-dehydropantoate 2-reductase
MKTLIYGAGPIGQWLALQLAEAGKDVTLLARGNTLQQLKTQGVVLLDGYTGERHAAHVPLVDRLEPDDHYDDVVVAMRKSSRLAVCPTLAANTKVQNILFLGNDITGFHRYFDYLPKEKVLLDLGHVTSSEAAS